MYNIENGVIKDDIIICDRIKEFEINDVIQILESCDEIYDPDTKEFLGILENPLGYGKVIYHNDFNTIIKILKSDTIYNIDKCLLKKTKDNFKNKYKNIGALLLTKWVCGDKPNEIIGYWVEDFTPYTIIVPPQLRSLILTIQNDFYYLYNKIKE